MIFYRHFNPDGTLKYIHGELTDYENVLISQFYLDEFCVYRQDRLHLTKQYSEELFSDEQLTAWLETHIPFKVKTISRWFPDDGTDLLMDAAFEVQETDFITWTLRDRFMAFPLSKSRSEATVCRTKDSFVDCKPMPEHIRASSKSS